MFLAPNFFHGRATTFLGFDYKAQPDTDRVEEFHGDWPREFGAPVAK